MRLSVRRRQVAAVAHQDAKPEPPIGDVAEPAVRDGAGVSDGKAATTPSPPEHSPYVVDTALTTFVAILDLLFYDPHRVHEVVIVIGAALFIHNYRRNDQQRRMINQLGMALAILLSVGMMAYPTSRPVVADTNTGSGAAPSGGQVQKHPSLDVIHAALDAGTNLRAPVAATGEFWALRNGATVELRRPVEDQPLTPIPFPTGANGTALAAGDGVIAAIRAGHVTIRNRTTGLPLRVSPIATGRGPISVGLGCVWASDPARSKLYQMTLPSLHATEIAVPSRINGLVIADGSPWVSTVATRRNPGELMRINLADDRDIDPLPLPTTGKLIAFLAGTLWISTSSPGGAPELTRLSIDETQVGRPIVLRASVVGIAGLGTTVFVLEANSQLVAVDTVTGRKIAHTTVPRRGVTGIVVLDRHIFVTDKHQNGLSELVFKSAATK